MIKNPLLLSLNTNKILRSAFIFTLSLIYLVVYTLSFSLTHLTIFAALSFIFLIPVTWIWGFKSGVLLLLFNVIWTTLVLSLSESEILVFSINAVIGVLLQTIIVILIAFIRSFHKKIKKEVEERKKAEDRLIEYQNKLEQTIKERTEALENAYIGIYHNEKMQAVGQLAGGIAHDFNNKMTVILGYCDLLMKKFDPHSQSYKYLEQIRVSGLQSSELTRQLLAFARKGVYQFSNVNIDMLISEIIALLNRSFPQSIIVRHSLNSTTPFVWGGTPQLQNAILNIALNAKDAMPSGGTFSIETSNVTIDDTFKVTTGQKFEPGEYVRISLTDTGPGIDPEIQKNIFEPFFTTKKDGKGIGMGLAAVYGIVESHKGFITVSSILNEGTTFIVYLPVTQNESTKSQRPVYAETLNGNDRNHVFVIDDKVDKAETIKTMLKNSGYIVTTAFSVEDALHIYSDKYRTMDIVLIDMSMSILSAREFFLKLKVINPSVTALLVSDNANSEQVELSLKDGVAGFIQKPFERYNLHISIQRALGLNLTGK
ncbi:MAG: response regulator [Chitinispirillaceae bacterium]|nr:response regulator [Chitinispirillaceae bacterium]